MWDFSLPITVTIQKQSGATWSIRLSEDTPYGTEPAYLHTPEYGKVRPLPGDLTVSIDITSAAVANSAEWSVDTSANTYACPYSPTYIPSQPEAGEPSFWPTGPICPLGHGNRPVFFSHLAVTGSVTAVTRSTMWQNDYTSTLSEVANASPVGLATLLAPPCPVTMLDAKCPAGFPLYKDDGIPEYFGPGGFSVTFPQASYTQLS